MPTEITIRRDVVATYVDHIGGDHRVCEAARVSVQGSEAYGSGESQGLINFLMRNRHGSPFEHGAMTFCIEAPIFVAREFMRHRIGWSYNEESGRYKVLNGVFYQPGGDRPLVQVGKTGEYRFESGTALHRSVVETQQDYAYEEAWASYQTMLKHGVAKEVARMVLPVGTYTSFFATANPRSIMHFLSLRTREEGALYPSFPQQEIEEVARQIENEFEQRWPLTHAAFNHARRVCP